MKLSKRAAIEPSSMGVGVSTSVRKYVRNYYAKQGVDNMANLKNKELNDVLAADFLKAQPLHRFKLRSKEVAEIRKSHAFYYVAKVRKGGGGYDLLVIQPAIKQPSEEVRKHRLQQGWGGVIY